MTQNKTEKFKERVYNKKGPEYEVLGEFKTYKTKIKMLHNPCGYKWETTPDNFLRTKFGCPKCSRNARMDTESFVKKVYSLVGKEYSVLGEYVNARTPIHMKHESCGFDFKTSPGSFLNLGTRCPKCAGRMKRTSEDFIRIVNYKVGNEYTFLDPYVNNSTKVRCRHNKCGYVWETTPANFLDKDSRCPKCAGNASLTNEEFLRRLQDLYGSEYKFLEEYKGFFTPIQCKHNKCGYVWSISPNNILKGRQCPNCRIESNGEQLVRFILDKEGIYYVIQKTFENCRNVNKLPFDFYIPNFNMVIEYDGEQHFNPVDFGNIGKEHSEKCFNELKFRDNIKTKYCKDNGIYLLRIPYTYSEREVREVIVNTIKQLRCKAEGLTPNCKIMI